MAEAPLDPAELEQRLWDELDKARFGMLGLVGGPPHHFQPMTMFCDREARKVWFYSHKSSDLVQQTGPGASAMLCVMATDQEFQACLAGQLVEDHDRARIDYYWSKHVSAWFPGGKDDPDLTLLRLDTQDARVWISRRGPFNYGWQIAKANMTKTEPDIGGSVDVKLG